MNPQDSELKIEGYDQFSNLEKCKRGVIIYTRESLNAVPISLQEDRNFEESVWCRVNLKNEDVLTLGVIYRSPNSPPENHERLRSLIHEANNLKSSHLLIMGDFNYSDINWRTETTPADVNHVASKFMECLRDCFLYQHVKDPTHYRGSQKPNTLDLLITNEEGMVDNIELNAPIGKSHHVCMNFEFNCYIDPVQSHQPKYIYHKGDYTNMRDQADNMCWAIPQDADIESAWRTVTNNVKELMDKFIPKTRPTQNGKKRPPYMTAKARSKVKEKKKTFRAWKRSADGKDYLTYAKARNQAKWACRQAERDFERRIAREAKTNPKAFYKYAQSKMKTRARITNLTDEDGNLVTDDKEKADLMNRFFTSVFTDEDLTSMPNFDERDYDHPLTDFQITPDMVKKKLQKLNPSKSPGPDGMHPRVLRELKDQIAGPLCHVYSKSLQQGILPKEWKTGWVSPIHKKNSRLSPSNYRPVSLTSVACKIMEQIIRDQIIDHLVTNELLSSCQHGFIKGRSCITQLLATLDHWTEIMDGGGDVDAVYLDFSKCFDSVPHERLLMKLDRYGIKGRLWKWVADFLRGRHQQVSIRGCLSAIASVLSGIPQGSVLGPLLFVLFVNEMPEAVHTCITMMFADDTKLFTQIKDESDVAKLQDDIDNLQAWADAWQLRFNPEKCKVLHLGRNNQRANYTMTTVAGDRLELQSTDLEKDLGVWIDPSLTFSSHCETQAGKANRTLGLIRRTYSYLDEVSLTKLYTSLVRCRLEYGYPAWAPMFRKDCELLERVQRRATRLVPNLKELQYEERLQALNLPSLYYRRARGDLIEIYKHTSGAYTVKNRYIKLEPAHGRSTRGHNKRIAKPRTNKRVRENFLVERAGNTWNRLPADVVNAPSLNSFKGRLDKHWANYRYSQRSPHDSYKFTRSHLDRPNLLTGIDA